MSQSDQQLVEKWTVRLILGGSLIFSVWFVGVEWQGLRAFVEYLVNAVVIIPESIDAIVTYYGELPSDQLLLTLIFGAGFGGALTVGFYLILLGVFAPPLPSTPAILVGISTFAILFWLGVFPLNAFMIAVIMLGLVSIVLQSEMRTAISHADWRQLSRGPGIIGLILVVLLGMLGGLVGGQIFAYPMQHCTYVADAPSNEYQAGVFITLIGVCVALLPIWTVLRGRFGKVINGAGGLFSGIGIPVAFLFPTLLSLIVFLYFPAVQIVTESLNQSNARIPGRKNFVCLENYTRLFDDITYQNSFSATIIITVAVVMIALALSLAIATLASQKVRGAYIYRTLLIWPYALSPVVAGVIFLTMFQQESGLINYVLDSVFGINPRWFTDVGLARVMVVVASVWNILGFNILFYIAGLQNIPKDLLEAAEIDGANRVQRFARITFPLLSPFTFFLLVTNITYSFYGIYGVIDVLTDGGPRIGEGGASGATDVLIYRLYEGSAQAGASAAQALVLFVLIASITIFQFGYLERRVTYAD